MFAIQDPSLLSEAADRLSELVSDLDLDLLLPSVLADVVGLGEHIERLGHCLKTRAAAKVASTSAWQRDGDRTAEDWLARRTGTSRAEAGRLVDTARKLEQLPATAEAMRRGQLSSKQAEAIAGAGAADPSAERRLLDHAQDRSLRELQEECRRTRVEADADPEATARRVHARRTYRMWTDADGATGHLHLTGPVANMARMDNAIRHRAEHHFRAARTAGRREPAEAYAYDAAEELLTSGTDAKLPTGADAKIIVRVDHAALVRGRALAGEICEVAGIGPVPVTTVQEWMRDAFVAAVLTKGEEVQRVVHLGRRFTAVQRTALQWTDPICARRGCGNRLGLEYDHFEEWAATHTTRVGAAKRFCRACHGLKSTGWHVSDPDDEGQCTFTQPREAAAPPSLPDTG